MRQLHVIVHGKVQGVWYRAWTRDTANEMGVTGWVRNMTSGDVEATAYGDAVLLEQFLTRLWDGPPLARVTAIDTEWSESNDTFKGFEVRR